eukprot:12725424-Prorocentrum_lima.AAC.1
MGTGIEKRVRKHTKGQSAWVKLVKARLTASGFKDMQAYTEKPSHAVKQPVSGLRGVVNALAAPT